MLEYFKKNNLVYYPAKTPKDWEEAIRLSSQNLITQEYISEKYVEEIIQSIKNYGPYIVIIPNVAMPHAEGNNESVYKSGISFTKFKRPVIFYDEKENEEKTAILFFALAAKNAEEHLQNITNLTELLSNETLIESLMQTETLKDFDALLEKV